MSIRLQHEIQLSASIYSCQSLLYIPTILALYKRIRQFCFNEGLKRFEMAFIQNYLVPTSVINVRYSQYQFRFIHGFSSGARIFSYSQAVSINSLQLLTIKNLYFITTYIIYICCGCFLVYIYIYILSLYIHPHDPHDIHYIYYISL